MLDKHLIRFATLEDVDAIMTFINANWKEGHLLATNKSFFLYEYHCGERINFALAIDVADNKIVGLCGFIKNTEAYQNSCIWGSVCSDMSLSKLILCDSPNALMKLVLISDFISFAMTSYVAEIYSDRSDSLRLACE